MFFLSSGDKTSECKKLDPKADAARLQKYIFCNIEYGIGRYSQYNNATDVIVALVPMSSKFVSCNF